MFSALWESDHLMGSHLEELRLGFRKECGLLDRISARPVAGERLDGVSG